jgi:T5orf172 domain
MDEGYIYCFSNESMPGILKVGVTERTPEIRLNEANSCDTWRPPTPYKLESAKKVLDSRKKEIALHKVLSRYSERINPKREFFRITVEEVKLLIDLMDGEVWIGNIPGNIPGNTLENTIDTSAKENTVVSKRNANKKINDMPKYFINGQRIRHVIDKYTIWIGVYNKESNGIIHDDVFYRSLSTFATSHHDFNKSDKHKRINGWRECEFEINGKWVLASNATVVQ